MVPRSTAMMMALRTFGSAVMPSRVLKRSASTVGPGTLTISSLESPSITGIMPIGMVGGMTRSTRPACNSATAVAGSAMKRYSSSESFGAPPQ
ncbi:hypothetical protein D3C86_1473330 [compost metagenome]